MNGFYSLLIAVSMYSRIPVPMVNWTKERMAYVMCWFPIVGVLIGIILELWIKVGEYLKFSPAIIGLVGTVIPVLATGGIHMDGFLDTWDALGSCREQEKKLEILKDPHVGAFGVISCCLYFLVYGGLMCELAIRGRLGLLLPVFVMERAFSGLSVVFFPCAKKSGLAAAFSDGAKWRAAAVSLAVWLCAALGTACLVGSWGGNGTLFGRGALFALGLLAVQGAVFFWYRHKSLKEFGGITGDLAGWFLQICEAASLCWVLVFSAL